MTEHCEAYPNPEILPGKKWRAQHKEHTIKCECAAWQLELERHLGLVSIRGVVLDQSNARSIDPSCVRGPYCVPAGRISYQNCIFVAASGRVQRKATTLFAVSDFWCSEVLHSSELEHLYLYMSRLDFNFQMDNCMGIIWTQTHE